jgi:hypothetical protein
MTRRLAIFQIILLGGLSLVFALPKTPPMKDAALHTKLPNFLTLSAWRGGPPGAPSLEEEEILADDTEFYRRDYRREVTMSEQQAMTPRGQQARYYPGLVDMLNASIVLSGKDLSNSIHALERCLTAQGFNIPSASTMHVKLRTGQTLAVRRLLCERANPETKRISRSIAYYWFVGHDYVTSNHIQRGIKDFMDRILRGYDQRWAYITVTAYLDGGQVTEATKDDKEPKPVKDDAGNPLYRRNLTEADADRLVDEFIFDLGPEIIRIDEIKEWPKE